MVRTVGPLACVLTLALYCMEIKSEKTQAMRKQEDVEKDQVIHEVE